MLSRLVLFIFLIVCPLLSKAVQDNGAVYSVGDHVSLITLRDQRDKPISVDEDTRLVLFANSMSGGRIIGKAINKEKVNFMSDNHTVYISNISGMPGIIARMVAVPGMRKHPYSILLDHNGKATNKFPSIDGDATLVRLDKLEIKSIKYTDDSSVVKNAIISADR